MENKRNLVVLASLLHDIGKLFERANTFPEITNDPYYLEICPHRNGYYSHLHCAYTKKFCEVLHNSFNCLKNLSEPSWIYWASGHHLRDTDFEIKIISTADRLSAEEREEGSFYTNQIHRRTLLEPVLERVYLNSNEKLYTSYRYPLARLDFDNIFPLDAREFLQKKIELEDWQENAGKGVTDPNSWSHLLAKEPLYADYQKIANGLLEDVKYLSSKQPDLPLKDLIVSLLTLLEIYTVNIPSATNLRHPDISLFDHLRTTAAIAQALCFYSEEEIYSVTNKWTLVCGDFSGIQKFIYNLTNKGAAKHLKARSFYVQYFCQVCADFLLKKMDLSKVALLYNSGGKFYLLIPTKLIKTLQNGRNIINQWLLEMFGGSVFLGLGLCDVSEDMFSKGNMHTAWARCAKDLEKDRKNKFKDLFSPNFFLPQTNFNPTESCQVCGSKHKVKNKKCYICRQLEKLGKDLHKSELFFTLWTGHDIVEQDIKIKPLLTFDFTDDLKPGLYLLSEEKLQKLAEMDSLQAQLIFINDKLFNDFKKLSIPKCEFSFMYLGRWKSKHYISGEEWTFEDYSERSNGIKRLGILRMDVDNLGMVFISGLMFPKRKSLKLNGREYPGWGEVEEENNRTKRRPMASISRMATLSRQLNCFFGGYINKIMESDEFSFCQIMYAGGDDLFIIGAWDQLIPLAKEIKTQFQHFCCYNPDMSISGGITLIPPKYPIYKGAILAGEAEKRAKECREEWEDYLQKQKNLPLSVKKAGFCFIDTPILWEDFYLAEEIKELLVEEVEQENNKGLLSYLLKMQAKNITQVKWLKNEYKSLSKCWLKIEYNSWRWRFTYQLRRRYNNNKNKIEQWSNLILGNAQDKALLPVFSWLGFPLNWVKLLHRK